MPSPIRSKTKPSPPSSPPAGRGKVKTSKGVRTVTAVRSKASGPSPAHGVRHFRLGDTNDKLTVMRDELDEMKAVLMGHEPPPIAQGIMTLMEVADAYYARAKDMEGAILRMEADGLVLPKTKTYRFRTGELRSFIDMAKAAAELGSRRITAARLEWEMREEDPYSNGA